MTLTTAKPCTVHNSHYPRSHINEIHHVWPLGHGGPDVAANKVTICATGHNNVHQLLDAWLHAKGDPGWPVRRGYAQGEQALARLGYEWITRGAL